MVVEKKMNDGTSIKLALNEGQPEIFHSIQGEGKSTGVPSVFVRTSACNLHCIWCDTPYTWNWEGTTYRHVQDQEGRLAKFDKGSQQRDLPLAELVDAIRQFGCTNVIFTGGEPMLQQQPIVSVMRQLRQLDERFSFEVETNGTLEPIPEFDREMDQYNVSVKLANSGVPEHLRLREPALRALASRPQATFKFVVQNQADLDEIEALMERHAIRPEAVWLMPEGTDSATLRRRLPWLVEVCKRRGFNLSDRLHIHLFGDRRGV